MCVHNKSGMAPSYLLNTMCYYDSFSHFFIPNATVVLVNGNIPEVSANTKVTINEIVHGTLLSHMVPSIQIFPAKELLSLCSSHFVIYKAKKSLN